MHEIERKFLVHSSGFRSMAFRSRRISQGYLNSEPSRTVRVRISDNTAFLTIKGPSSSSGLSRYEWEEEIRVPDAQDLLQLCEPGRIEKIRHEVKLGKHTFEVDEFLGENKGLVLAELELSAEDEEFLWPEWLGEEVTGDRRYYNSHLSKNPFRSWKD